MSQSFDTNVLFDRDEPEMQGERAVETVRFRVGIAMEETHRKIRYAGKSIEDFDFEVTDLQPFPGHERTVLVAWVRAKPRVT